LNDCGSAYLFQGGSLLVGEDTPDDCAAGGIDPEIIKNSFENPEIFEVPPVDGPGKITGVSLPEYLPLPRGWRKVQVRQVLALMSEGTTVDGRGPTGRMLRAYHIAQWRADSRFCGNCGTENTDAPDELARLCPACGRLEFPRISPAVITIIINDKGQALLAHNKKFAAGLYSLIAGFNEAGESLESTVVREIREEVNLEVRDVRYVVSQPWPFPNSLMLGFTARYDSGEIRSDGIEIEDAQWFSRDKLPKIPGNGSVSRYLIDKWIDGKI
jgi:NAD+ diphosphatase